MNNARCFDGTWLDSTERLHRCPDWRLYLLRMHLSQTDFSIYAAAHRLYTSSCRSGVLGIISGLLQESLPLGFALHNNGNDTNA